MKLVCQQCSHENEVERIYCHNCGTKLDRSSLPPEDPKAKKKKKRTGPSPVAVLGKQILNFILTLLLAAVAAAVWCVFKPVGDSPEISEDQKMAAPFFSTELEAIAASGVPISRSYEAWKVNAYVKDRTKPRKSDVATVRSVDGWVNLAPDQVTVVGRIVIYGMPSGFEEVWEIKSDSVPAKPRLIGAKLGRLTLPPAVAGPLIAPFSQPFYKRLESELKLLKQLGAKVEKDRVTVFSGRPGGA